MKPSHISSLISVSAPAVSPDGATVAAVLDRVDEEQNRYCSQIWLASADGRQAPRPFTSGEYQDANPTWSPDGSLLAFTSSRGESDAGAKTTLHVAPVTCGGEVVRLATLDESAAALCWSPDGR
ncbi:MAG: hypothetical protein ACRDO2_04140, partial [Nocardioidaceae bacterium]